MQRDGDAVRPHVYTLDQQPEDPRLLGRVELVPDWLEDLDDFLFAKKRVLSRADLPAQRGDGPGDQLGRRDQGGAKTNQVAPLKATRSFFILLKIGRTIILPMSAIKQE